MFCLLTNLHKIRFVVNNHIRFSTPDKISKIISNLNITIDEFDLDIEPWYIHCNWWNNKAFIASMQKVGINTIKNCRIKMTTTNEDITRIAIDVM